MSAPCHHSVSPAGAGVILLGFRYWRPALGTEVPSRGGRLRSIVKHKRRLSYDELAYKSEEKATRRKKTPTRLTRVYTRRTLTKSRTRRQQRKDTMTQRPEKIIEPGRPGFHGELCFLPVDSFPASARTDAPEARESGRLVVGHSETGHCHVILRPEVDMYPDRDNDLVSWLEVRGAASAPVDPEAGSRPARPTPDFATLEHEKVGPDAHAPVGIPVGKYKVVRQREHTPEGWRQVAD